MLTLKKLPAKNLEDFFIKKLLKNLDKKSKKSNEQDSLLNKFTTNIKNVGSEIIYKIMDNGELICENVEDAILSAFDATEITFNSQLFDTNIWDEMFYYNFQYFIENDFKYICIANKLFNIDSCYTVAYQFADELLEQYNWSNFDDYQDEIIDSVLNSSITYGFTIEDRKVLEECKPFINWEKFKQNVRNNADCMEFAPDLLKI